MPGQPLALGIPVGSITVTSLIKAEMLAGLECVDLVVGFEDDNPEALVRTVEPDILVKGADWKDGEVAGADFVRARGGEVEFIDILPGRSTTGIAERIRNR